jgi:alpha-beta hydrolase superfamily lysophospholipase
VTKSEVRFASGSSDCAGWWYDAGASPAPCVVMAHGFSLTMRDGLAPYAEAFAAAGFHVLVFDHRHLGESGGEPRGRFRIG